MKAKAKELGGIIRVGGLWVWWIADQYLPLQFRVRVSSIVATRYLGKIGTYYLTT